MNARTLTDVLKGHWHGSYGTACCPAHGDRDPSLSISDGQDGRLLVRCFAGCDFTSIMETLHSPGLVAERGTHVPHNYAVRTVKEASNEATSVRSLAQAKRVWNDTLPIATGASA